MKAIAQAPFTIFIAALLLMGCSEDWITNSSDTEWISDIPFVIQHVGMQIPHDNRILETDHFLVFSDASSDAMKREYARKAERALCEVLHAFRIANPAELGIHDQSSKITIYTNKEMARNQIAFPYGFLLYGEDSEYVGRWSSPMKARYYNQVKHEMVHVVQFLHGVLPNTIDRENEPDRWFNEGLAECISGGFFIPIETLSEVTQWRRQPGHINPMSIHEWSDLPIAASQVGEYYPMFGLALRYILDQDGLGKSMLDVRRMFATLAANQTTFAEAFEMHFGLSLAEFESSFFVRIEKYME